MSERAKLRYDGLSYYAEDLEKIALIYCKNNNYNYQRYSVDRILNSVLVWHTVKGKESMAKISFEELKSYRIPLTNEKPIINWASPLGHFIYYRMDIWVLADLVTDWNGYPFKEYRLDNSGKFLYIYFQHPEGKKCFIGMDYRFIENVRCYLYDKNAKGIYMNARAWGENLDF